MLKKRINKGSLRGFEKMKIDKRKVKKYNLL